MRILAGNDPRWGGDVEILGYGGAKGGGKSWFTRTYQKLRRMRYAGSGGLIVRKTFDELEKNHISKLKKELPEHVYDYREQKHQFRLNNGSFIDCAYIDQEKDLEHLQGAEYDDISIDEACNHGKVVFSVLRSCLRTTRKDLKPKMLLTWNWGGVGHGWLKKMFWRRWMWEWLPAELDRPEGYDVDTAKLDTWDDESHWDIDPLSGRGERPRQFAFLPAFHFDNPHIDEGYVDRLAALPESLRKAYMYGSPDVFEGQFFPEFGPHLREMPFVIPPHECNLYGSLDYGDGDGENASATSFGLWHVDKIGKPHRLLTYYRNGGSPALHARNIVSEIRSFPWTSGKMPKMTVADPAMFTKRKFDDRSSGAAMAFSVADVFSEHGLPLTEANNQRVNGWRIMREAYSLGKDGTPNSFYWDVYNSEYELYIPTLQYAKGNRADVKKGGEDHIGDDSRYFFAYAMGLRAAAISNALTNRSNDEMESAIAEMRASGRIGVTGI